MLEVFISSMKSLKNYIVHPTTCTRKHMFHNLYSYKIILMNYARSLYALTHLISILQVHIIIFSFYR